MFAMELQVCGMCNFSNDPPGLLEQVWEIVDGSPELSDIQMSSIDFNYLFLAFLLQDDTWVYANSEARDF